MVRRTRRSLALLAMVTACAFAAMPTVTCARMQGPRGGGKAPERGGHHREPGIPKPRPTGAPGLAPSPSASGTLPLRAQGFRYRQLAIGQGDAALLECGSGETALVDAGPAASASTLVQTLKSLGREVSWILISHGHADHYGGLGAAVGLGSPPSFIVPQAPDEGVEWRRALASLHGSGARVIEAKRGDTIALCAGVDVRVLAPSPPPISRSRSDVNANGIVLRVDHHGADYTHRFLLTGDAELETEARLLEDPEGLRADVLKVAHHGSAFSSSLRFLEAVAPSLAIVSSGSGNDYHHPHGATLQRLLGVGARILRTDLHGTVSVTSGDEGLTVETDHEVLNHLENVGEDGGEANLPKEHRPRHRKHRQ